MAVATAGHNQAVSEMIDNNGQRDAILRAAIAVARSEGFGQVTIDAIAREAGLSKGGVLYHFASKTDLFRELLIRCDEWRENSYSATPPPSEQLAIALLVASANDPAVLRPFRMEPRCGGGVGSREPFRLAIEAVAAAITSLSLRYDFDRKPPKITRPRRKSNPSVAHILQPIMDYSMAVPQNRSELLLAIEINFDRLIKVLEKVPAERVDEPTMEGHAKGTVMSVSNLVAYLVGWNELVLKWLDYDAAGKVIEFPEEGFKWNQLGRLAQKFYADHQHLGYRDLLGRLKSSKNDIVAKIKSRDDTELYGKPWYTKWTMGRMIQFNTASPYRNSHNRLRKSLKAAGRT